MNGLNFIEDYPGCDIVFMDIEMPQMNGIEAAKKLRAFDTQCSLIFVTNMARYAVAGYEVDAMDFLVKPVGYFNFSMKLKKAVQIQKEKKNTYVLLHTRDGGKAGKAKKEFAPEIKKAVTDVGARAHLGKNDDRTDYVYNTETEKTERIEIPEHPVTSSGKGIRFMDLVDSDGKPLDYYSPKWDELVQCLSADELYSYLSWGFRFDDQLLTIHKKISVYSDCPMGFNAGGTLYPCYPIQAGTFSKELASRLGEQMAEEAKYLNIRTWWSPTCNTHRHPFGGKELRVLFRGRHARRALRGERGEERPEERSRLLREAFRPERPGHEPRGPRKLPER